MLRCGLRATLALRATVRACSTLSRAAALAVPRPPLLAAASVRDRPSSSLQSWSVAPPSETPQHEETPQREPLLLGGLLGIALDLPGSSQCVEPMEMGKGPRRTRRQWEHLVKTRKWVKSLAKMTTKRNAAGRKLKRGR